MWIFSITSFSLILLVSRSLCQMFPFITVLPLFKQSHFYYLFCVTLNLMTVTVSEAIDFVTSPQILNLTTVWQLDVGMCFSVTGWVVDGVCVDLCNVNLQHRTLMHTACRLFSARMHERIPITKRFPKQVKKAMTQTDTLRIPLANRSSNDEIPSVLGLHLRTCGA